MNTSCDFRSMLLWVSVKRDVPFIFPYSGVGHIVRTILIVHLDRGRSSQHEFDPWVHFFPWLLSKFTVSDSWSNSFPITKSVYWSGFAKARIQIHLKIFGGTCYVLSRRMEKMWQLKSLKKCNFGCVGESWESRSGKPMGLNDKEVFPSYFSIRLFYNALATNIMFSNCALHEINRNITEISKIS